MLDAHDKKGDGWDLLPISGKSVDGATPLTIAEYYDYNKEALGAGNNQSINRVADKDRKNALKFIERLEGKEDGGAAAWKAALIRMSPWKTSSGQLTDSLVGGRLYGKPVESPAPTPPAADLQSTVVSAESGSSHDLYPEDSRDFEFEI